MEERSLRVLNSNTTFFSKISTTISKLLVPTKVGINGVLISLKRSNVLKSYEAVEQKHDDMTKEKKKLWQKNMKIHMLYI